MDPYAWQRHSLSILHDHPYCRPPYLEPVNSICVEPTFMKDVSSEPVASEFDGFWVDVTAEDEIPTLQSNALEAAAVPASFVETEPALDIISSKQSAATDSSLPSKHNVWHISAARIFRQLKKTLARAALEISVCHQQTFQCTSLDVEFRRASQHSLIRQRVSRTIRKAFGFLHWRTDVCVELHETLLNTLPCNLLSVYLEGFGCLYTQKKVTCLLDNLNSLTLSHQKVRRFPYGEFVDWIKGKDLSTSVHCHSNQQSLSEPTNGFSPISLMPSTPICEIGSTIGRQPSSLADADDPIFVCVMLASQAKSLRIARLVRDLSRLGRVVSQPIPEDACETPRLGMRCLIQRLLALMDENRPVPIYLVGFGITCPLMITAALQLPASYSNSGLEKVLCGRLLGLESPAPSRPWLSGLICLGIPLTLPTHQLEVLAAIGRRCSVLLLVGGRSRFGGEQEASRFRDFLIAARRRAPPPSEVGTSGATGGEGASIKPHEFDLQLLIVGGADHLLRLHTSTARRWSTTQAAVDYALIVAMKNFVYACRNLSFSNCDSTETQSSFTPGLKAPPISPSTGSGLKMQPRQVYERGNGTWRPPSWEPTSGAFMHATNPVHSGHGYHQQTSNLMSQLYRQTNYEKLQSFRQRARDPSDVSVSSSTRGSHLAEKRNVPGFGVSSWEGICPPSQHRYQPPASERYGETAKRKTSEGSLLGARSRPNKRLRRQSTLISQTKSSPPLNVSLRDPPSFGARETEGRDPYAFECGGDGDSGEGDPLSSPRRQPESSRFPSTLTFSQVEKSVPASSQESFFRPNTLEQTQDGDWITGSPSYLPRR
ncbi:hypothetical protein AAHC03_01476 [Spirometra sp. Aus1]